jgi:hypothetical protein
MSRQPWLYSAGSDSVFILAPAFVVTLAVLLFSDFFAHSGHVTPGLWLLLVVGVDVAHVYSTLYRTYLDREESDRYRNLLIWIPVLCWIGGIVLYSSGRMTFWRVLAYLAVFHFIRQQYGFLRLYSRKEAQTRAGRIVDGAAVYMATVYPLVYWHTHPRDFQWFIPGDFFAWNALWLERLALFVYVASLGAYVVKAIRDRNINVPKHLTLLGTALSWYTGIVLYNGDLAFTVTNVVAHGIPYMALVWIYERKKGATAPWFKVPMIPVYIGLLLLLAYVEEGFWDVLVWRDHTQYFGWMSALPRVREHAALSLIVPLLAVPQATHYVLDGFIWRLRKAGILVHADRADRTR